MKIPVYMWVGRERHHDDDVFDDRVRFQVLGSRGGGGGFVECTVTSDAGRDPRVTFFHRNGLADLDPRLVSRLMVLVWRFLWAQDSAAEDADEVEYQMGDAVAFLRWRFTPEDFVRVERALSAWVDPADGVEVEDRCVLRIG